MNQQESFGETIKQIRKEQNMTQKMLAQGICAQSVLSRIENGLEIPNVLVLQSLCQRLNVTMEQILHSESEEIQRVKALFSRIHSYLIHKEYQKMSELLKDKNIVDHLHFDTDFQLYYYYLGSCEFFLTKEYNQAIQSLKKGLSYTYSKDTKSISPIEILIMSCLGRVYSTIHKYEKAQEYLKMSHEEINHIPEEITRFELTKVFFNYAQFLYDTEQFSEALTMAKEGIRWGQRRLSYYHMEELFSLCGQIYEKTNKNSEAELCFEYAKVMKKISEMV